MKSYDILINSEPYLFGSGGGIDLGSALLEPGTPKQLGTMHIPSAHHGFGQAVARDPMQAGEIAGWEVDRGVLVPAGGITQLTTVNDAFSALSGAPDRMVATFVENNRMYVVFPRKIVEIDGELVAAVVANAPVDFPSAGDHCVYTSAVKWRGSWIVVMESTSASAEFREISQR